MSKDYEKKPMEELWSKLKSAPETCKSLLKKHLTEPVYNELKGKKTKLGGDIGDCIQSGSLNLDSGVGLYACDPDAYNVFSPLFDAVIMDYHKVPKVEHPPHNWGSEADLKQLGDLDPEGKMIVSTRVRVGRSHKDGSFPPTVTAGQRKDMEKNTVEALNSLSGELDGKYYSLESMSKEDEKQLIADHFLFKDDDRFLREAGGYKNWPNGRGIYFNKNKTFLTWINEEDHLRFISMQKGGDLGAVYKRLKLALDTLEKKIPFAYDEKRGYLTFCPTNLGTAMRASVHIAIPNLQANQAKLKEICDKYNLQPRGIHGEHTESEGGVFDISNKRRLGLTEWEAVNEMRTGVLKIIEEEKKLAAAKK